MSFRKEKSLFKKLLSKEQAFFDGEFLAPVYNCPISVKIAGVLVSLRVQPASFNGWGIFRTNDGKTASLQREARPHEKRAYLELFPRIPFMVVYSDDDVSYGVPVGQQSVEANGLVPILLSDNVEQFDVVYGNYNGRRVWFNQINRRFPRNQVILLRNSLRDNIAPENLDKVGKKAEAAYKVAFNRKIQALMSQEEYRIKSAVNRAGGEYVSHSKRGDSFVVNLTVDGQNYSATLDQNLRTQSAGICLSGRDRQFDLQSLVGVYREGQERRSINRGDFTDYYDYDEDYDDF